MISSTRRAVVLLIATFVLGAALGAAGFAYTSRTAPQPQGRAAWYLDRLTRNLDLTPVQQDSVKAVLDRYTPAMDSLMSCCPPLVCLSELVSGRRAYRKSIVRRYVKS